MEIDETQIDKPGGHNGRELDLMLAGKKPMSSFLAEDVVPPELIGDAEFQPYAETSQIEKFVVRNEEPAFEMRTYCLPTEEWRGNSKTLSFAFHEKARLKAFSTG